MFWATDASKTMVKQEKIKVRPKTQKMIPNFAISQNSGSLLDKVHEHQSVITNFKNE